MFKLSLDDNGCSLLFYWYSSLADAGSCGNYNKARLIKQEKGLKILSVHNLKVKEMCIQLHYKFTRSSYLSEVLILY